MLQQAHRALKSFTERHARRQLISNVSQRRQWRGERRRTDDLSTRASGGQERHRRT
jgi:hypothetical protein